jgi:hypothetical protein
MEQSPESDRRRWTLERASHQAVHPHRLTRAVGTGEYDDYDCAGSIQQVRPSVSLVAALRIALDALDRRVLEVRARDPHDVMVWILGVRFST